MGLCHQGSPWGGQVGQAWRKCREGKGTRPGPSPLTLLPYSAQPGAVVSSSPCETCRCEVLSGPQLDRFMISCETQTCNTHCPMVSARRPHCPEPPGSAGQPRLRLHTLPPQGFEYQAQSGQCCGLCVQVACVMNTSDSAAHLFYVSTRSRALGQVLGGVGHRHPTG